MSETEAVPAEQGADAVASLTDEQDGRLRTLAALREFGELSPELQQLRRAYRERDQRADVRPPDEVVWPDLEEPRDQA
jgi:hypothetical protein